MKISGSEIPVILSLDPRGLIINEGIDTIYRHYMYAKRLNGIQKPTKTKYVILSSNKKTWKHNLGSNFFQVIRISNPTLNIFLFASKAKKCVQKNGLRVELIVAGDCWENFWCAVVLSKLLREKIPIQVQVHGDIADPAWRRINFKNRIRFFAAKQALLRAAAIRCVSNQQKLNLITSFGLDHRKIYVVPVPIKVSGTSLRREKSPRSIGFIGRIHEDRGIWNFIELVRRLNMWDTSFKLLIAGDGPDRVKFLRKLEKVFPKNRVRYLGKISQGKLKSSWQSIGVLVSMAPVESYGRVLRESLLAGVPVWATPSSGVVDLLESAEPGTVKVLEFEEDNSKLYKDFESLLKIKVGPKFRDKFIKENNSYSDKLAKSWIDTIEKFKK
jgi:glycosyltransferase involved in cell wall biosynthesis